MIQLENVTKTYPKASRPSLDNVNVAIEKGEFVFFIGPSGSGKSTMIKLLLHEVTPSTRVMWRVVELGPLPAGPPGASPCLRPH